MAMAAALRISHMVPTSPQLDEMVLSKPTMGRGSMVPGLEYQKTIPSSIGIRAWEWIKWCAYVEVRHLTTALNKMEQDLATKPPSAHNTNVERVVVPVPVLLCSYNSVF